MTPIGPGGGARPDGIWLMTLSFERVNSPISEEEARKLIIQSVDDFLLAVNSNEELRPYLKNYPFTVKNLSITIFNYDGKRELNFFPSIAVVKNSEGEIGFLTKIPLQKYGYHTKKYETYEEAVAILKNQK